MNKSKADQPKTASVGVDLAISCAEGTASALARHLGVSPQAGSLWKKKQHIPVTRAIQIAKIFRVKPGDLNPILQ